MNHVAINFGLSGLLTQRSPREMIEGYFDPFIETLNETPVWMGGDKTTSSFLSLAKPPTLPNDNKVALFTGENNSKMTRTYGNWLNQEYIMLRDEEYVSISETNSYLYSPWEEKVFINGTDGMQFSPDLSTDTKVI